MDDVEDAEAGAAPPPRKKKGGRGDEAAWERPVTAATERGERRTKCYIEVGGAVHAVSLAVGKASDATEVLQRLRAAAAASGTPELSDLGSTWTTHYLDSDGRPQLLTRSTPIKALRKTKAFRVAITDEVEVELPPESVIMDH